MYLVWVVHLHLTPPISCAPAKRRKALGVGNEYVQLKRLTELVQDGLRDNLQEEEERRAAAKARAAARRAEEANENREGPPAGAES